MTLLSLALTAWATTTASISPNPISPGDAATLRITTDTGATPRVQGVPGVQLQSRGQSSELSIYNGQVTQRATFSYQVIPSGKGSFMLGPFQVGPDTTEPVTLVVDGAAATSPQPHSPRKRASGKPGRERAFLSLWLGDDTPYVGQSVPLTVSAYLRDDVGGTLEGIPELTADDFLLEGMDEEPTRTQVEVKGRSYTRFTWTASLTPVRAGTYPLKAQLPATLQWAEQRQTRRRRSLFDEMLASDPFLRNSGFAQMFGNMGSMGFSEPEIRSAHVDLKADRGELEIMLPPVEGRPPDFQGAVGTYTLSSIHLPSEASVGEPIELSWEVTGTGNIATLQMDGLAETDAYRTYPPERDFQPSVRSKTKGTVRFTQLIVPKQEGPLTLPDLSLSYLDPATDSYQTLTEPLPSVTVFASGNPTNTAQTQGSSQITPPVEGAIQLPWTAQHGILWLAPFAWLSVLVAYLGRVPIGRGLRHGVTAAVAAWRRASLKRTLRSTLQKNDAEGFFRAGIALVHTELGEEPPTEGVRSFLRAADRTLYARQIPDPDELTTYYEDLLREIKEAA